MRAQPCRVTDEQSACSGNGGHQHHAGPPRIQAPCRRRRLGGNACALCRTAWRGAPWGAHRRHTPLRAPRVRTRSKVAGDHLMGGTRVSNESSPLMVCSRMSRVRTFCWSPRKLDHACREGASARTSLYHTPCRHARPPARAVATRPRCSLAVSHRGGPGAKAGGHGGEAPALQRGPSHGERLDMWAASAHLVGEC
jgi:hypothetical protein